MAKIQINGWYYINDADDFATMQEMTVDNCNKQGFYATLHGGSPENYPCFVNADLAGQQIGDNEVDIVFSYLDTEAIRLMAYIAHTKEGAQ
jgi:hypothetical protein